MEIILIVLTGAIISACMFVAYLVGYHQGGKKVQKKEVELTETNADSISQLANWLNFRG